MVTIQPFEYEKTTAFKERVQIANKVNELIGLFNELDIESKINIFNEEIAIINTKITEINKALNDVNNAVNTVEGYNTRLTSVENESISLDARLDNIEPVVSSNTAKIGVLENKDLENMKLSGNQTIEDIKTYVKSPIVPNPPSGDTSTKAVNTNWISQTGNNAPNNLIHKSGNETRQGTLTFTSNDPIIIKSNDVWAGPTTTFYLKRSLLIIDVNDNVVSEYYPTHDINGTNHTQICTKAYMDDGNGNYTVGKRAILDLQVSSTTGKCRLILITPNGTSTPIVDWTD